MGPFVDFPQGQWEFSKWQGSPDRFLAAMPEDWQADFLLYLETCTERMELYAISDDDQIMAGGAVLKGLPPDMELFEKETRRFVEKGYLYIGFLFVDAAHRGQNIGSSWLKHLFKALEGQGFWLTVEDPGLIKFYEKNGFRWIGTLKQGSICEDLLVLEPNDHDNPTSNATSS